MIQDVDPSSNPDHLNAPTEIEIAELTHRVSPGSRARLEDAARGLLIAKMMASDTTPWRELVDTYRTSAPVRVEVEVVHDGDVPRVQVAYIERGFGLSGAAGRVHSQVGELVRALDLIEQERELNSRNGSIRLGPPPKETGIRECLTLAIERHGKRKLLDQSISWIVERVRLHWPDQHGAYTPIPADNTIRRVIELCLPDHPRVQKKKCKKAGS